MSGLLVNEVREHNSVFVSFVFIRVYSWLNLFPEYYSLFPASPISPQRIIGQIITVSLETSKLLRALPALGRDPAHT
ncbi:MAG: hypothetical protein M3371_11820 [Acidobacteriota bacterium]|nr:hypothetical protein [Acidobacteriota bacterium]